MPERVFNKTKRAYHAAIFRGLMALSLATTTLTPDFLTTESAYAEQTSPTPVPKKSTEIKIDIVESRFNRSFPSFNPSNFHPDSSPSDPYYPLQYNLRQIGIDQIWAETQGKGISVAFIDTGMNPHPDLQNKIVYEEDFTPEANGRDGADHGTRTGGITGAIQGNGIGITGASPEVELINLKVFDRYGHGSMENILKATKRAVQLARIHNTRVINISAGADKPCEPDEQAVIDEAVRAGILVIAASGNIGQNHPSFTPASCRNVLSVGASDYDGKESSYSNISSVTSPGSSVLSTDNKGNISELGSGTSYAAPQVSSIAALIFATNPKLLPTQVREIIINTAESSKQVNAVRAIAKAKTTTPALPPEACNPRPPVKTRVEATGSGSLRVTLLPGIGFFTESNGRRYQVDQRLADKLTVIRQDPDAIVLEIKRQRGEVVTIPLEVTDSCGPWKTIAGAGSGVR